MPYEFNPHKAGTPEDIAWRKERGQYPYFSDEFAKEYKGYECWWNESKNHNPKYDEYADSYRVFCILRNHNYGDTYADTVELMKNATREKPIEYQGEIMWSEKI